MNLRALTCWIFLGGCLAFGLCTQNALAATAANTRITNQASLSYEGGVGVQVINASVTVTVSLVPALATLSAPTDMTSIYAGADSSHTYNYTLTAGGNGPDSYTLTAAVAGTPAAVNTVLSDPGSSTPALSATNINLGATLTTTGSSATLLIVPSDGIAGTAVNGIAVGDTVVVGGQVRAVTAVANSGSGTASITVDAALSPVPGAGVPIFERQAVTLTIYSGALVAAGSNIEVAVDFTASNAAGDASDQVTSNYISGRATLVKYVRNLTNPVSGTGGQNFTIQSTSNTYYTGGVTGRPGDVLEYLLLAENTGTGPTTDSTVSDLLPTNIVTFISDAYGAPADLLYVDEVAAESGLTDTAGDDQATLSGANLVVYVGSGATAAAGGSLAAGKSIKVLYRVTIN